MVAQSALHSADFATYLVGVRLSGNQAVKATAGGLVVQKDFVHDPRPGLDGRSGIR